MAIGCATAARNGGPTRADVRAYWERAQQAYLAHVGTTFQAGRITAGVSMRESNLWLARAAGLHRGQRVLDAGCGVCGPAIDIARAIRLRIVGLTIVPCQAATAATMIEQAGLSGRVQVVQGDFNAPPFAERSFDAVVFLESIGYAAALLPLLADVRRVLKPGGSLYVKDVFRRETLWSDQERRELEEFDCVYAQRTPTLSDCTEAAVQAGFTNVSTRDLTPFVTTAHGSRAMFDGTGHLTSFGHLHYRRHSCVPVYFAELTAYVPA
jgi:cyclopropane fatty-acyl-phospholipid synthase-like methyltransferase